MAKNSSNTAHSFYDALKLQKKILNTQYTKYTQYTQYQISDINIKYTICNIYKIYTIYKYALVIARFRVQYGQYFSSFSYFAEIKAKYEKQGKYWPYCVR